MESFELLIGQLNINFFIQFNLSTKAFYKTETSKKLFF